MNTESGLPASPPPAPTNMKAAQARHSPDALSAFARGSRNGWWRRRPPFGLAVTVIALATLVITAWSLRGRWRPPAAPAQATASRAGRPEGRLVVESRPSGARVEIDGQARGVTPLAVVVPAGRHGVALTGATRRQLEVVVNAGSDVFHHVDIPDVVTTSLRVEAAPAGAAVTVDGRHRGSSPITVDDLTPGQHRVVVSSGDATVTRTVNLRAGVANSVLITLVPTSGPATGWLSVTAPIEVEIYDGQQVVGKGRTARVLLIAGRHQLSLANRELGYEDRRTVNIAANRTVSVDVQPGTGVMFANAIPWAEVFLDGRRIGETPIANYPAALGTHEVLFRNPDLGELRRTVLVTLTSPARVGVNFRQ